MSGNLFRLTEKYVNTPQLITQPAAEAIFSFLAERNFEVKPEAKVNKNYFKVERNKNNPEILDAISENGIAILDMEGPLSYTVSELAALCGAVSYEQLQYEFDAAVESPSIHTIVQYIDSPGGEAYGCFEFANYMRKKAKEKGKRLITYVDGGMYSAALALGVASEEIIVNPFADVGSIGVLVRLLNTHKYYKKMGLEETYVYAGEQKIPYDKNGDFKKEFIDDLQTKVDSLYSTFVSHVASCTGMTEAAVVGTKARTFSADEAMKLGLVDKVMEREEFFNYLSNRNGSTTTGETPSVGVSMSTTEDNSKNVVIQSDEDNSEMPITEKELEALQAQLKQQADQIQSLSAANQKFLQEQAERSKGELKGKLSGYSFITAENATSLTEVLTKLQDSEKGTVLAVFDKAAESLNTLTAKVKELETKLNADMFTTVSARGESQEEGNDEIKKGVAAKIAAMSKTGENK